MWAKVDSAGRVILIPRDTFLQINGALDVIWDTFSELCQATFMRMALFEGQSWIQGVFQALSLPLLIDKNNTIITVFWPQNLRTPEIFSESYWNFVIRKKPANKI